MHPPPSLRRFLRAATVMLLSATSLLAVLAVLAAKEGPRADAVDGRPKPTPIGHFDADESRSLRSYWRALQQYRWPSAQPDYAQALGESRDAAGIDRLVYHSQPDSYLWMFDDMPDSYESHGVQISLELHHAQEFIDWHEALQGLAPAYPLSCRLWRRRIDNASAPEPGTEGVGDEGRDGHGDDAPMSAAAGGLATAEAGTAPITAECEFLWIHHRASAQDR